MKVPILNQEQADLLKKQLERDKILKSTSWAINNIIDDKKLQLIIKAARHTAHYWLVDGDVHNYNKMTTLIQSWRNNE